MDTWIYINTIRTTENNRNQLGKNVFKVYFEWPDVIMEEELTKMFWELNIFGLCDFYTVVKVQKSSIEWG